MNILILSWRDPKHPLAGGAEQVVLEHAKGWINGGHKVTWFSSSSKENLSNEVIDGVEVVRAGYQYLGVQIAAFFYYFKNRNSIDFIVDQFHGLSFFTPLYSKKPKIALIQEVAGKVWFLNPLVFPLNLIVGVLGFVFEPLVFRFYKNTHFMTGSESAKKEVFRMKIPLKNITVVPHGVILSKNKIKVVKSKKLTVTYLGIISKDKGIEDVVKSFSIISNKLKNVQFWIIGKGESEEYLKKINKLVKELKLNKKVKMWGYVKKEQKFRLLAKSHVLVNASIHEGWGLVNIEANAYKTPVVAYNSSGLVDSVKNEISGIICKENTPQEIALNVIELLEDKDLYRKYQYGALKWSQRFSWDRSRKLSLLLINKVFII